MEKKKIQAKPKLNASEQEALLNKLQQNTAPTVNTQQVAVQKVVEIKEVAPTAQVEKQEIAVKLQQNIENTVNDSKDTAVAGKLPKIQRITVDMPIELYEKMKDEVEDNGQTIKGFIVNLVKFHFTKKN
jgi:hypothetical protein